jgi:hypothetical protein
MAENTFKIKYIIFRTRGKNINTNEVIGTVQLKLIGVESDINQKVFLSH